MNLSGIQPRFCLSEMPLWVQSAERKGLLKLEGLLEPFLSALFDRIPIRPYSENVLFTELYADFGRVYSPNNATGLIRYFVSNECDISLSEDEIRLEALDYVDYASLAIQIDYKITSSPPINRLVNTFKLVEIFDVRVWIALLISMLIISILLNFEWASKLNALTHFLNLFAVLLLQGNEIRVNEASRRLFWGLWICSFFILSACFSLKLLSQLALPDTLRYFDSLRDLVEFPKTIIRVPAETPLHYFFLDENSKLKRTIFNQVMKLNGLFNFIELDPEVEFDEIKSGKRVMIMDEITIFFAMDMFDKCDDNHIMHFSKDAALSVLYSFATRKNFTNIVSTKWKLMALYYFEGGNFYMDFNLARIRVPKCMVSFQSYVSNDYVYLTVANISFPLFMWMVGVVLGFVISLLEIYRFNAN